MSRFDDLAWLDATALARLVRDKEVKPSELVEASIERIENLNPTLNAVITPMYDLARQAAAAPLGDGPLAGVPFLLKDIGAMCAGVRFTLGAKIMSWFVADHDSELVRRLRQSGLIFLGKTNLPELGLLPTTETEFFGPCHNPWDITRTPGGSSGGAAAAVASGMVPTAHGNDGGGSIRIPASCCGLFGLKPTRGRNPLGPDFGDIFGGLVADHALTRSVRDSALLLDVTSGPDLGDPYWAPPPARPFVQEVGADPGRLRIALTTCTATGVPVHPDCVAAAQDAAKLCQDLGHIVEEDAPTLNGDDIIKWFTIIWSAGCAWMVDMMTGGEDKPDEFEILTWALRGMGRHYSAPDYMSAIWGMQGISRQIATWQTKYDLWLTPTLAEPPLPLGSFTSTPDNPLSGFARSAAFAAFTPIANATGQPAMSVPLYWNADGLPIGAHFIARFGDEATLFRIAAQLEAARPWAGRRPPVCVGSDSYRKS